MPAVAPTPSRRTHYAPTQLAGEPTPSQLRVEPMPSRPPRGVGSSTVSPSAGHQHDQTRWALGTGNGTPHPSMTASFHSSLVDVIRRVKSRSMARFRNNTRSTAHLNLLTYQPGKGLAHCFFVRGSPILCPDRRTSGPWNCATSSTPPYCKDTSVLTAVRT